MSCYSYNPNIRVHVQPRYGSDSMAIYITNSGGEGYFIGRIVKNRLEWEKQETEGSTTEPEPTMTISRYVWELLKHSIVGTNERDKHTVEAELGATKYHLEDMRKLVFKKARE